MIKSILHRGFPNILTRVLFTCDGALKNIHMFTSSSRCGIMKLNQQSSVSFPINDNYIFYRLLGISSVKYSEEQPEEFEKKSEIDPSKDRTKIISPETSIRYLKSKAYKITYGDEPVWVKYRRNFKGQFMPKRTRESCVKHGVISTGNPCPICRDEYLVLHYTNVDLLKQFIHPQTGEVMDCRKIQVCRRKLIQLEVAIMQAKFYGLLTHVVPFRKYNYEEFYPEWKEQ